MTDIRCAGLVEEASALLDGSLAAPARGRLADHLAGCEGCRRYLDQMRATVLAIRGVRPRPGESLPDAVHERLRTVFARSGPVRIASIGSL